MNATFVPRPGYRDLAIYRGEKKGLEIDLSDNTNLFGSAPSALAAMAAWAAESPARYPAAMTDALRGGIADWLGVAPDQVACGCGSNDILDSAMRASGQPGSRLAYSAPTFVMASHFASTNTLVPVAVPALPDGAPDIDALLAVDASLIYLATPNNPSGRAAPVESVTRLLDRAKGVVILDEAYVEYAGGSRAAEAVARGNVLVTRTFSKAWGLAGLRLGYGIGAAALVSEIDKARGPFKVNAVAERAATAAVLQDRAWLADLIAVTRAMRESVTDRLRARGFSFSRSDANFLAVPVRDARAAAARLAERGVGVRSFAALPGLGDVLRITIGPEPMMDRLVDAMSELDR